MIRTIIGTAIVVFLALFIYTECCNNECRAESKHIKFKAVNIFIKQLENVPKKDWVMRKRYYSPSIRHVSRPTLILNKIQSKILSQLFLIKLKKYKLCIIIVVVLISVQIYS